MVFKTVKPKENLSGCHLRLRGGGGGVMTMKMRRIKTYRKITMVLPVTMVDIYTVKAAFRNCKVDLEVR